METVADRIFRDYIMYFETHDVDLQDGEYLFYEPKVYYNPRDPPIIFEYLDASRYFDLDYSVEMVFSRMRNGGKNQKYILNRRRYHRMVIEMKTGLNFSIQVKKYNRIKFALLRIKQYRRRNKNKKKVNI